MIHMIKKWKIFKKNWGKSIIQQQKTYLIWILKPSHTAKILDKDLVMTHKIKTVLILHNPEFVGTCILT